MPRSTRPLSKTKVVETHSRQRTLVKSISWRFVASGGTVLIAYLMTGELKNAFAVGLPDALFKLFVYYLHERLWLSVALQTLPRPLLMKSLSWKTIAIVMTMSVAYVVTGSVDMAMKLGWVDFLLKMLTFYLHEQLWHRVIHFGKTMEQLKET